MVREDRALGRTRILQPSKLKKQRIVRRAPPCTLRPCNNWATWTALSSARPGRITRAQPVWTPGPDRMTVRQAASPPRPSSPCLPPGKRMCGPRAVCPPHRVPLRTCGSSLRRAPGRRRSLSDIQSPGLQLPTPPPVSGCRRGGATSGRGGAGVSSGGGAPRAAPLPLVILYRAPVPDAGPLITADNSSQRAIEIFQALPDPQARI